MTATADTSEVALLRADLKMANEANTGLQSQLKRERELCDKLIEATEKDRASHSIDPIYDRNVREAIAAIHSERGINGDH